MGPHGDTGMAPEELTDIKYVGPATAAVLGQAGVEPTAITQRRISHTQLVSMGVNPGVAAKIRREHSLSWSLEGGTDLDRRAKQVRGLQDGERDWVAASVGDWDADRPEQVETSADGTGDAAAAEAAWRETPWPNQTVERADIEAEADWRKQSAPRPVTDLEVLGPEDASLLAEGGITSVRSLATCDPERVAESLDLSVETVRKWREAADSVA